MKDNKLRQEVRYLNTFLGTIEYRELGIGCPVLLLHGGHSNCLETISHAGIDISKFRLIIPSRPGYGLTSLSKDGSSVFAARLIAQLLGHLKVEEVLIYGISAGGPTAIAFASLFPHMTKKLVLASAVTKTWLRRKSLDYISASVLFMPGIEYFVWSMVHHMFRLFPLKIAKMFHSQFSSNKKYQVTFDDALELRESMSTYRSYNGFVNGMNQLSKQMDNSILTNISCPALIIHSRFDQSIPLSHGEHAAKQIPNSRLKVIENGWGHLIWIGDGTGEVYRVIENFFHNSEQDLR